MKYHVNTTSRGTLIFNELPKKTYFLSGYQDEQDKGLATYLTWDNGTCLIPIIETATGKQYRDIERAGTEII